MLWKKMSYLQAQIAINLGVNIYSWLNIPQRFSKLRTCHYWNSIYKLELLSVSY